MPQNRLAQETSPYLLQHQNNPVNWYPWGDEAFQKARSEMKLVFLSIGYSACHWCHVMERESFESEEIAEVLNQHFVSIKVDREERPDVDGLYMDAVQRLTGHGGWPLSAFLLPDGRPVYGGTYFPPDDRYGRPGFRRILEALSELWKNEPDRLAENAKELTRSLDHDLLGRVSPQELVPDVLQTAIGKLSKEFDPKHGGFGRAPKFPQASNLSFLLKEYGRSGNDRAREMALKTLQKMAQGGIYDQLGGGFHRYSTDDEWLAPHFEKMLYDNALLVRAYLQAFQITGDEFFKRIAGETLAYVEREMISEEGGFFTAQDADSEGEEGKFFVWQHDEVLEHLGPEEGRRFAAYFDVTPEGNWEGKNILRLKHDADVVAARLDLTQRDLLKSIEKSKQVLMNVRSKRVWPGLDDKILTSWNGMMLTSFVEAYSVLREERYLQIAVANASFLVSAVYDEKTNQLLHAYKAGHARYHGFIDDYAYFAEGLIALFESTGDRKWLDTASRLCDRMIELFWDEEDVGFYFTHSETELIVRRKEVMDNAIPSGNSVALHVLQRLSILLDRRDFRDKARALFQRLAPMMQQYPSAFGYALQAYSFEMSEPPEIVIAGDEAEKFLAVLSRKFIPHKIMAIISNGGDARLPLTEGKSEIDGKTAAYVCRNYACQVPVTSPEDLLKQLSST